MASAASTALKATTFPQVFTDCMREAVESFEKEPPTSDATRDGIQWLQLAFEGGSFYPKEFDWSREGSPTPISTFGMDRSQQAKRARRCEQETNDKKTFERLSKDKNEIFNMIAMEAFKQDPFFSFVVVNTPTKMISFQQYDCLKQHPVLQRMSLLPSTTELIGSDLYSNDGGAESVKLTALATKIMAFLNTPKDSGAFNSHRAVGVRYAYAHFHKTYFGHPPPAMLITTKIIALNPKPTTVIVTNL